MGIMMQHIERELQYRHNSDSGSVMGNSTDCSSAVDEGKQAKHQQRKGPMPSISVILLQGSTARAHSSLGGSVDFWVASDVLQLQNFVGGPLIQGFLVH